MDHGIKNPDISKFALKILRENKLRELNENMPKADAFQRLCYDLLVQDFKDRGSTVRWSPYRTAGQDGAVDISGEDDLHQLFIAECKKNDSPELAENSLRELSNTLMRNLEKAGAPDSLYGAWFDPRLKKYIYCVSCCFDNLTARENFKSKVSGMLMGLAELKGLAHLEQAAENVELYSWEDLSAILSRSPFIYHQWIEYRLPPGVEGLSRLVESGRAPVYREYLSSARLAYFSRDDYVRQNPKARGLATETEILDSLLNRDIYNGCILYGEGGIGKTRLMLELGYRAEQQGWLVYKIISKSPTIETLRDLLSPGCNHLLLFDYIEESNVFETPDFFYKLVESCRDAVVKVIGNCRKSHMELSLIQYAEGFFKRDISIKNQELEQDFKNRVVSHILGDLKCFFRLDRDFYELRPAFAVFLKYLNKKYCLEKELDFREEPSFRLWLQKQLCRTYHAANYETLSAARERLYLFFILSASAATPSDALISTHEDDVLRLLKDGWLDKTTETARQGLTVVHDTVSEEILLIRLQERRELWENEIESIFAFASRHGKEALANCFTLFERVSDWFHGPGESGKPFVDKKKFSQWMFNLFYRFIEERPGECAVLKKPLVMTALMDELDNVALLVAKGAFFEEVIKDRHFGLVLALKMKHLQKQRAGYSNETMAVVAVQVKELLARWFSFNPDFLQDRYISARVIASFIMLFGINCDWGWGKDGAGESVISQVKRWLEMFHNANEASFIFQSWLDAGGEKEVIRAYVGPWLEKYPLEMETYFIMKSWLDTGGEKENIKDYVGPWLMKSWLDAGGEKEIIKAYVVPWLKKYPLEMETHFVMKSWLDAKGDKEVIKDYVGPWLKKYNLEMETSFVIQSWLDAGGEKEIIKEYVGPWLKKYPLEMETSFVMKSWLDAGGEKEVIKDYVGPWLEKYPLEMETHFVIKSWLDAGGEKEIIKAYAGQWLKKFNLEMETSFVIQSWLDAGGEKEIITAYVGPWLKKYPLEMETRFVMKSWLDAGGEKEVIKEYVGPWLKKYPLEMETHFVIKSWLDAKGEKEVI
ncbi:MAG: hypothetical protein NT166_26530, partial [Candidatus Aminicenantes bacterium]|nr:hypothetical protein [Candidatus Aminicenantes bacterium]